MEGLIDGYNSEGEVDEPGARKDVQTTVGEARCGETWMRWNDFSEKHTDCRKTEYLDHHEPRAHDEKNCAR